MRNNKLLNIIIDILNKIDPEELKPGQEQGAPMDEYNQEAQLIYNFIHFVKNTYFQVFNIS